MRSALCVCVCVWCVCVCVFLFLETGHRFVVGHSPRLFLFNGAVGARHGRPKTVAAVATAARHRFRLIERLSLSIDTISLSLSLSLWFSLCECAGRSGSDGRHFHWRSSPWKRIRPIADDLPAQKSRNLSIRVSPMGGNERAH